MLITYSYINKLHLTAAVMSEVSMLIIMITENSKACKNCLEKPQCTQNKNGRTIFRNVDQGFFDTIDLKTKADYEKYKKWLMIVEQPFGTIKHIWSAGSFVSLVSPSAD